ncbi:MAG: alanine racemase [Nitrospirae bacterium GWC2_56_14]|nr:MAG: alanine racemase [Nitrospirae bacterium GWC2_56_14]
MPAGPGADRPTAASISLSALTHNFEEVTRRANGRKVLAVVKANAYGHGLVPVARHLLGRGAHMLGVALVEEGRELREAGIEAPILVMGPVFPEQADAVAALRLTPALSNNTVARALDDAARKRSRRIAVHVKIDTGMSRTGVSPEAAPDLIRGMNSLDGIVVEGLMTHFADADLRDKAFAAQQMERFENLIRTLTDQGISIPLRHAANSASILDYPRALFTMVRPGLMLYGYDPVEGNASGAALQPVLSLVTRIFLLKKLPAGTPISYGRTFVTGRESLIATIPIGYADGFSRSLSNCGEALVRGARVPVTGRVCMDMTMLDVTDVPGVREGDEVVLIGSSGSERITAADLAAKTGTIPYEVLCGISSRVPRIFL